MEDQLENSRIQQQSWEIIFFYYHQILFNRVPFSWKADPSCLSSLCYKQHSHKSSSWLLFQCHSCTSPVHCWLSAGPTGYFMSGLSWTHQANRSIPHWILQFKKHAAYFPGSTFHAKVSQFFLSHLYSHKNQKLYQSHGISQFEIITKAKKCEDHSGYLCVILLENPFSAFCYVSSWLPQFDIADRWHIKYIHTLFFTVTPIFVLPEGNGDRLGGLYWTHINTD